jgi:WD40 repeat protein
VSALGTSLGRLALLACLALLPLARQPAHAAAPPGCGPVDRYGDPLPRGVVARLGTLRFAHVGGLSSVAVSPDGKVVASGGTRQNNVYEGEKVVRQGAGVKRKDGEWRVFGTIRLWDTGTGKLVREILTPDAPVSCLRFGRRGRSLFAGCGNYVCAWDLAAGKKLWQEEGVRGGSFQSGIFTERFLWVGAKLVSLHGGSLMCPVPRRGRIYYHYHPQVVARLWDRQTGRPFPIPTAVQATVDAKGHVATLLHAVAFSPDGRFAAALVSRADPLPQRAKDTLVERWKYTARRLLIVNLVTGKVSHTLPGGKDMAVALDWSAWEKAAFGPLAFSPDGSTLAISAGGEVALVQTASGRKRVLAKGLSPDPRLTFVGPNQLAARLADGKVRAWDVATGKDIRPGPAHAHAFVPAHDGRVVAAADGSRVRLTDLRSGKPVHAFEGHPRAPLVRFALHSRDAVLSSDGERACLWRTGSWKLQATMTLPGEPPSARYPGIWESMDEGVSWERGLYVKERDNRLELREVKTDQLVRVLAVPAGSAYALAFSASGDRLVASTDDSFRFFDVGTGKVLSQLPGSNTFLTLEPKVPQLSPRGTYFAKHDGRHRVALFDVRSGKLLRRLSPKLNLEQAGSVLRFHFSADEQTLIGEAHQQITLESGSSGERVSVTLWDVGSGEVLQELVVVPRMHPHWRAILSTPQIGPMCLSPDRRLVALAKRDGKDIEVWETASGLRRGMLAGHDGRVVSVSFSPDGKYLASGSEDTTVLVWDMRRPSGPVALTGAALAAHWDTLSRPDAEKAGLAIGSLTAAPRDAVAFLKERLPPAARPDAGRLKKLFTDLDSDDFKTRCAADEEIESFGERALGALENAVRRKNSAESLRRLKELLRKARAAAKPFGTAERLRAWRALEVLERIATAEAVGLLKELAGGAPDAVLTREARAALARLGR